MTQGNRKTRILFLCTGNSCRSQMAEGWARHLKGEIIDAYSAGILPQGLDPRAVQVMAEAGVDISSHYSRFVREVMVIPFDYVVTVCGHADEHCPVFPGPTTKIHRGFEDPSRAAPARADEQELLKQYRRVRDEIRAFVETLPEALVQTVP
jgi:arsenate reductase (thioredoxin)